MPRQPTLERRLVNNTEVRKFSGDLGRLVMWLAKYSWFIKTSAPALGHSVWLYWFHVQ